MSVGTWHYPNPMQEVYADRCKRIRAYCLAYAWVEEGRLHPVATDAECAELESRAPNWRAQSDGASC